GHVARRWSAGGRRGIMRASDRSPTVLAVGGGQHSDGGGDTVRGVVAAPAAGGGADAGGAGRARGGEREGRPWTGTRPEPCAAPPLGDRLVTSLRGKRILLLLDNVEHLVAARDALLGLLESCLRLVVLATSRAALRVRGEREYRVAPLELPAEDAPPEALARAA